MLAGFVGSSRTRSFPLHSHEWGTPGCSRELSANVMTRTGIGSRLSGILTRKSLEKSRVRSPPMTRSQMSWLVLRRFGRTRDRSFGLEVSSGWRLVRRCRDWARLELEFKFESSSSCNEECLFVNNTILSLNSNLKLSIDRIRQIQIKPKKI